MADVFRRRAGGLVEGFGKESEGLYASGVRAFSRYLSQQFLMNLARFQMVPPLALIAGALAQAMVSTAD